MSAIETSVGESEYHKKEIQPWHVWEAYNLNPWRADMVKRLLRTKPDNQESDRLKMIHIATYLLEEPDVDRREQCTPNISPDDIAIAYKLSNYQASILFDILDYPLRGAIVSRKLHLTHIISALQDKDK